MNEPLLGIAFEFAFEVSKHDDVLYVLLFGSVAKNTAHQQSDIDLLVVLETDEPLLEIQKKKEQILEIAFQLEKKYNRDIQVIVTNRQYDGLDTYFVQKAFGEGHLLYAKKPQVLLNNIPMEAYTLVSFELNGLSQAKKMKLRNRLYGYRSSRTYRKKKYTHQKDGLLSKLSGRRLGRGAFLLPRQHLPLIEKLFDAFNVTYRTIDAWLYASRAGL
ncbi:MAG: nucleotidyltransferase family protein [Candidatus Poribacteria bacterium]